VERLGKKGGRTGSKQSSLLDMHGNRVKFQNTRKAATSKYGQVGNLPYSRD
jgi:hypothetical protein